MKNIPSKIICIALLIFSFKGFSQEYTIAKINVQRYTPSKLLNKGQWDIKFFNNLYTQNSVANSNGNSVSIPRENYFTTTLDIFTGVSENIRLSIG